MPSPSALRFNWVRADLAALDPAEARRPGSRSAPRFVARREQGILGEVTTPARSRRHLASSPFVPDPEPAIEVYAVGDLVSHDSYGLGRVTHVEAAAVTVDFQSQMLRITSPYRKMVKL